MKIAIYDFDGTLYRKKTMNEFSKFYFKKHPAKFIYILIQFYAKFLYSIKLIGRKRFKEIYLSFFEKIKPADLKDLIKEFWEREYPVNFRSELLRQIEKLRIQNVKILCVSSTPEIFIKGISNRIFLDKVIATKFVQKEKKYVIEGEDCRGSEKIRRIKEEFDLNNSSVIVAYSDNLDDLPLIQMAKHSFMY